MKQYSNMCSSTEILKFVLFFILNLLEIFSAVAVDHMYESCAPKMCGNLNVTYPFYIRGQQGSYCGFSELGINCDNSSSPIIHIPANDYVVDDIFYHNRTLRVHLAAVTSIDNCLPKIGNIAGYEPYVRVAEESSLHLLTNCTGTLPEALLKYRKYPCGAIARDGNEEWGLAMFGDDENLKIALEKYCKTEVATPVKGGGKVGDEGVEDYEGVLNRGFVLNWTASDCSPCERSGGRCGFNATAFLLTCFCPDGSYPLRCIPPRNKKLGMIIGSGVSVGGVVLLTLFFVCFYKFKKYSSDGSTLLLRMKTTKHQNLEAFTRQYGSLAPKWFPYSDIKKMTNSFKDQLGKGGFGTVYKGKLLDDRLVAVKILNEANGNDADFVNEVLSISRTSHVNVVKLLGFCVIGKKRALVYEYMPNGSLEKYIHAQKNSEIYHQLGMDKLYKISLGVARGLEYLHRGCNTRILHFDIKPHNILLDEDFCPKISDFGMAMQCTNKDSFVSIFGARGTIGYIAPELISRCFGVVSYKSDVYSYGMMILEIVGRRKNVSMKISHASEIYFPHWAYQHLIIHKDLQLKGVVVNSEEEDEIVKKIILVGLWCIQKDPSQRPTMSKVIEMLEGNLHALEIPPKPFFDSPSTSSQVSFDNVSGQPTSTLLNSQYMCSMEPV